MKRTRVRQGSVDRGRNATRPHARCRSPVMTSMQTTIDSPVGPLALTVDDDGALTRLGFGAGDDVRRSPLRAGRRPAARVLRRRAHRLRPRAASRGRHRLRAARLDRAPDDPVRRDRQLRRDRGPHRPPRQGARRRPRQRPQPGRHRLPVPPGHRQRRLADRLRRRAREQAHPARPRGGRADPGHGYGLSRIVSRARRRSSPWRACVTSCVPPASSASSSPLAWRGCPWARSGCCSSCTPSSSPGPTPRAASRPAPTRSRSASRIRRSRASSTAAGRRSSCASARRWRPPRSSSSPRSPTARRSARSSPRRPSPAPAQPPVGACMRALWPVLLDSPDRRHAAYSMEGARSRSSTSAAPS